MNIADSDSDDSDSSDVQLVDAEHSGNDDSHTGSEAGGCSASIAIQTDSDERIELGRVREELEHEQLKREYEVLKREYSLVKEERDEYKDRYKKTALDEAIIRGDNKKLKFYTGIVTCTSFVSHH